MARWVRAVPVRAVPVLLHLYRLLVLTVRTMITTPGMQRKHYGKGTYNSLTVKTAASQHSYHEWTRRSRSRFYCQTF